MNPADEKAGRRRVLLCLVLCILGGAFAASFFGVQALCVGDPGLLLRASPGDHFTLRYTHSMYGVEVEERFRVGSGLFTLFHVKTSPAALEYFGIEHPESGNVSRSLDGFSVPAASVGNHWLLLNGRDLELRAVAGNRDSVPVRLVTLGLFTYLFHSLWR
jgi:hypothetical protein